MHAGINKLLMAEKEATEVVKAAKEGEATPLAIDLSMRPAAVSLRGIASTLRHHALPRTVDALPHQCTPARPQH